MTKKKSAKFAKQEFTIAKGLSQSDAYKAASKKATRDFRGMKYDKVTGKVTLI